jgi:hypothetical protein
MKKSVNFVLKGNQVSFLTMLCLVISSMLAMAQAHTPVFARVLMQKVPQGKEQEFEKFMKDTYKPVHQLRKQKGKIINWLLFKVHFTGANDEYNYVTVQYYNSWANTEANDKWADLLKEVNPKTAPVAVGAKLNELSSRAREAIYYRNETVEPKIPVAFKYVQLDFMKVKPGMGEEYLKVEREDWKPFHQLNADNGKAAGWGLWQLIFPGGSATTHDFATSTRYINYNQSAEIDYAKTFKQANPTKDATASFERADKSRSLVRSELWED